MIIDKKHIPNLICYKKVCKNCLNIPNINCFVCEEKQFETNEKFFDWLIRQDNFIAIALNMKAYDGVLMMLSKCYS